MAHDEETSSEELEDIESARVQSGWKNKRGNTGGILRKRGPDGEWRLVERVFDIVRWLISCNCAGRSSLMLAKRSEIR